MACVSHSSPARTRETPAFEWILLHAGFVAIGAVTTLLGPILPTLAAHWSLDDRQAGFFFTAQFLGSLLGVFSTSFLLPRRGYAFVLPAGFALIAAGVSTLGFGSWTMGCLSVLCYGIGLGLTIPAANLYVATNSGARSVAALSILNLAWGVGAVFCPLMVIQAESRAGFRGVTLLLGGITALFALVFALSKPLQIPTEELSPRRPISTWIGLLRRSHLISLAFLFFFYVGTESALGGWIASHVKRAGTAPDSLWVLTPSAFWGLLLLGRALSPIAWRYLGSEKLARIALAMAALGALLILVAGSPGIITISAGLAGLGLAPVFPILVAWLTETLGADAHWAGGLLFGSAGLGGAVLPWLVGVVSKEAGFLRAGLGVPLLSCVLMLYLAARRCPPQSAGPI